MITNDIKIFEDYNNLVESTFTELLSSFSEDDLYKLNDDFFTQALKPKEQNWENEGKSYLNGLSPIEFFNSIDDTEKLINLFNLAANTCDREIPNALVQALINVGEKVHEILIKIAYDKENRTGHENIVISAAAIYVLGKTNSMNVLNRLLVLLKECSENDVLIMESITNAIKEFGFKVLEPVCEFIKNDENIDYRTEYLIMILPFLSKDKKSDDIYRLIKNSFLRMDNKILGASALAEYGDGRAIPALRGYLEKNALTIDKETFYEVKKCIEMLGGNIEGIVLPHTNLLKS